MNEETVGALLLRGGLSEYRLGLASGEFKGEGCDDMERLPPGLVIGLSCGDPFCLDRFI
jgi:hypothetical protein